MLALKRLQNKIIDEIDGDTVSAEDFSIMISQDAHMETLEDLPGVYYAWIENINTKEPDELINHHTGEIDEH